MPSGERLADSACADAYKASLKCEWCVGELREGRDPPADVGKRRPTLSLPPLSPLPPPALLFHTGLDDNAYDKAKCEAVFDAYKECKGKEYAARKRERLDARRGKKGRLFG